MGVKHFRERGEHTGTLQAPCGLHAAEHPLFLTLAYPTALRKMSPPSPTPEFRQVDPATWRTCAGSSIRIPAVQSRVFYFPQGHIEQSLSPPLLSPLVLSKPVISCRVLSVSFLANSDTDEVFAVIRLQPIASQPRAPECSPIREVDEELKLDEENEEARLASFAKVLTPSDANNGGGFSVPRFCADSIFPPLNFEAEPPVQTLSVADIHGNVWNFRHIYRGTPRRHLLTTGWSKFVNGKKLIAGDSVVFIRNWKGELFVGIRRAVRQSNGCSPWNWQGVVKTKEVIGGREGWWRSGKGRVPAELVAKAAELAARGMAFEIVYYPSVGSPDFVVEAKLVEEAMSTLWTAGVRVRMAMETDDSRMTWFQGTVSSAVVSDDGPWRRSPWQMLQFKLVRVQR